MRKIKFRAWVKEKMMDVDTQEYTLKVINKEDLGIVMQFTGLKDKNGKEIFEGDIVKGVNNSLFEVSFKKGCFVGCIIKVDKFEYGLLEYHLQNLENIEVIGNIYENPEIIHTKKLKVPFNVGQLNEVKSNG